MPHVLLIILSLLASDLHATLHRHFYCANQEGTKLIMCTHPDQIIGNASVIVRSLKPNSGPCIPDRVADNRLVDFEVTRNLDKCIGLKRCSISIGGPQVMNHHTIDHYEVSIDCFQVIEMCSDKRDYVGLDGFVVSPSYPSRFTRSSCQLYISLAASDLELVIQVHEFSLTYSIGCVTQYMEIITDESQNKANGSATWTQLYLWCGSMFNESKSSLNPYNYGSRRNIPLSSPIRTGTNNLYLVLATASQLNDSAMGQFGAYRGSIFKIRFWGSRYMRKPVLNVPCNTAKKINRTTTSAAKVDDNIAKKHKTLISISIFALFVTVGAAVALVFILKRSLKFGNVRYGRSAKKKLEQDDSNSASLKVIPPPAVPKRERLIPERILNVEDMHFSKNISKELLETEVYGASSVDLGPPSPVAQVEEIKPSETTVETEVKRELNDTSSVKGLVNDMIEQCSHSEVPEFKVESEKPYLQSSTSKGHDEQQSTAMNPLSVLFKRNSNIYYTTDFV